VKGFFVVLAMDLVLIAIFWSMGFGLGQRVGAYKECRRQWTTVDTAPAVWEHCNRRFGVRPITKQGLG
jgi:hypothetical protein